MARNEEKSQSMLYRFREVQAAELGLVTRQDQRPRNPKGCTDLRQCERWRGEILRDISRKVSKIQDAGLTDYEVRDLNDEINQCLNDKRRWEKQIISLGGANYLHSGVSSLDAQGRTVPGQRGYKYFGRAKDLPGVKELFEGAAKDHQEMEALKKNDDIGRAFRDQGPAYFGDLDEADGLLLKAEREEETEAWEDTFDSISALLSLPATTALAPPLPVPHSHSSTSGKRKAASAPSNAPKKTKGEEGAITVDGEEMEVDEKNEGGIVSVLQKEDLVMPRGPTGKEMEAMIMGLQKAALMKEYVN